MNLPADPPENPATPDPALVLPDVAAPPLTIRIMGVGGAGANAVALMAGTDLRELRLTALHTSARILNPLEGPEKILVGAALTHGLGAGGDPSLARAAAERDVDLLKGLCEKVDLLFIVAGLGGGTGTGMAPVLARVAKEAGALVIGVATLPFEIEGPRRRRQAQQGLAELKAAADTVICLPNQKIFSIVDENTSVLDSLKIANELLAQGIRGIWQMLTRPSLLHVDFAHLRTVLLDRHVESSFATAEAEGEGRARELIERLLAYPFLDGGEALSEADAVLVNLIGGPDLSMADIKRVMDEINRRTNNAQLVMGASISEALRGKVGLTLIASRQVGSESHHALGETRYSPPLPLGPSPTAPELTTQSPSSADGAPGGTRFAPAPQPINLDGSDPFGARAASGPVSGGRHSNRRPQQANLPLDIVSKGRFDKTPPTIHRGEDLDVPTYVRRGIPLN